MPTGCGHSMLTPQADPLDDVNHVRRAPCAARVCQRQGWAKRALPLRWGSRTRLSGLLKRLLRSAFEKMAFYRKGPPRCK
jgi:hypothetical protein